MNDIFLLFIRCQTVSVLARLEANRCEWYFCRVCPSAVFESVEIQTNEGVRTFFACIACRSEVSSASWQALMEEWSRLLVGLQMEGIVFFSAAFELSILEELNEGETHGVNKG